MFISDKELRLHALTRDRVAQLLFLNGLLVVLSYAFYGFTGGASVGVLLAFRNVVLFISIGYLVFTNKIISPGRIFNSGFIPVVFGILLFYVSIEMGPLEKSFGRILTFFIPFLYIYFSLSYIIANFGIKLTLKGLHYSLLLIYSIPLIVYIISGGSISDTNIYGGVGEDQMFAANQYGWSATIYILSYLFVWKDIQLKKYFKIIFGVLLPVAVLLFFTSANRTSWVSMAVAMIPFFVSYKQMHLKYKIVGILIVLGFISFLLADPNSSINFASEKSHKQEQTGEARFETAEIMFNHFNKEPILWLTGVGMFNFSVLKNKGVLKAYHNSYYEILFGAGSFLFLVFLSFIVFRPTIRYIKYYSKYTLLLPPLLIIPFFESVLTAGQLLFFPWFTFMLLMNAKIKYWNKETFKASSIKADILNTDPIINETNNPVL